MSTMILTQLPGDTDKRNIALGSIEWLVNAIKTVDTWRQREKSRAEFAAMSIHTLRDAGIDSAQIFIEGNKPFWEA